MHYSAIKRVGGTRIEAYAVRYGSPHEPDQVGDFFTPQTDLMLNAWGWPRPIFVEHTLTPEGDAAGAVGQWSGARMDAIGVKLVGDLFAGHPLYRQLAADIDAGKQFLSSDSAGHLVRTRPAANGTSEIVRWPLLTASLTKRPCEPRLQPVAYFKARGLALPAPRAYGLMAGIARANADLQFQVEMKIASAAIVAALAQVRKR